MIAVRDETRGIRDEGGLGYRMRWGLVTLQHSVGRGGLVGR